MRVLVTGKNGQVAKALAKIGARQEGVELIFVGRPECDLAHPVGIDDIVAQAEPDVVVNAAAWTAVDDAQTRQEDAFAVNAYGAQAFARAAKAIGVPIIQLSTDYVFAGDKDGPYVETDPTDPQTVYGASKLKGEDLVVAANPRHVILRTAWVYSETGKNFLKTMLRLAQTRDALSVVNDQIGTPTHADEIARGVLKVAENVHVRSDEAALYGHFHMTCSGAASWYDFAVEIFKASGDLGGPSADVTPVSSAAYPTPAKRPANSRLKCDKLSEIYGVYMAKWQTLIGPSISDVLRQMT